MVNEDAALLNRRVTHMTPPPHFSAAVYIVPRSPSNQLTRRFNRWRLAFCNWMRVRRQFMAKQLNS